MIRALEILIREMRGHRRAAEAAAAANSRAKRRIDDAAAEISRGGRKLRDENREAEGLEYIERMRNQGAAE